jgi:hypothetical protein
MASAGKQKGKAGERELAKILSECFEEPFSRVFGSGAFVGGTNAYRKAGLSNTAVRSSKADLIAPDSMPKMVVECKWYKSFPFHQLTRNDTIALLEAPMTSNGRGGWIPQTMASADPGDQWFLCMKFNNIDWFVLVEKSSVDTNGYKLENYMSWKNYVVTDLRTFFAINKEAIKLACS